MRFFLLDNSDSGDSVYVMESLDGSHCNWTGLKSFCMKGARKDLGCTCFGAFGFLQRFRGFFLSLFLGAFDSCKEFGDICGNFFMG